MSAHVYRAFDASGRLLYVGCTVELESRLKAHSSSAQWWLFHDRVESEWFSSHDVALEAEAAAIHAEHPRWNMQGRSEGHPDGHASTALNSQWLDYDRDVSKRHRSLVGEEQRLLKSLRKVRMGLAGVRAEAEAIKNGFVLDDEDVA